MRNRNSPGRSATIRAWRDLLHADWQREALPADWTREWDGKSPLVLPDGAQLELAGAAGFEWPLLVHPRRGGERITLPGRSHSHTLKHLLQDLGVPPWIREGLPLLSSKEGELLAAGDLAYSERFGDWLRHHNARLVWRHD